MPSSVTVTSMVRQRARAAATGPACTSQHLAALPRPTAASLAPPSAAAAASRPFSRLAPAACSLAFSLAVLALPRAALRRSCCDAWPSPPAAGAGCCPTSGRCRGCCRMPAASVASPPAPARRVLASGAERLGAAAVFLAARAGPPDRTDRGRDRRPRGGVLGSRLWGVSRQLRREPRQHAIGIAEQRLFGELGPWPALGLSLLVALSSASLLLESLSGALLLAGAFVFAFVFSLGSTGIGSLACLPCSPLSMSLQPRWCGRAVGQPQRIEVVGDLRQHLLVGGVDQPHDQEERHHRRHEVGVGDLPHAALVRGLLALAAPANDDELVGLGFFLARAHRIASSSLAIQPPSRVSRWPGRRRSARRSPRSAHRSRRPACRPAASRSASSMSAGPADVQADAGIVARAGPRGRRCRSATACSLQLGLEKRLEHARRASRRCCASSSRSPPAQCSASLLAGPPPSSFCRSAASCRVESRSLLRELGIEFRLRRGPPGSRRRARSASSSFAAALRGCWPPRRAAPGSGATPAVSAEIGQEARDRQPHSCASAPRIHCLRMAAACSSSKSIICSSRFCGVRPSLLVRSAIRLGGRSLATFRASSACCACSPRRLGLQLRRRRGRARPAPPAGPASRAAGRTRSAAWYDDSMVTALTKLPGVLAAAAPACRPAAARLAAASLGRKSTAATVMRSPRLASMPAADPTRRSTSLSCLSSASGVAPSPSDGQQALAVDDHGNRQASRSCSPR